MTVIRRDLITGTALVNPFIPRIGYANALRSGVVSASSEATDGPKEQAFDGLTYDFWRTLGSATEWLQVDQGSAQAVDYAAIGAHTLDGCNLTIQYSSDAVVWTPVDSAYTALDGRPLVWEFGSVSARYWRLLIENAPGAVSLGALHIGAKLLLQKGLPVGFQPPELNEAIDYTNTASESGQTLGRSVLRRGASMDVESQLVDYVWSRDTWRAFLDVAERYPVFAWWSYNGRAEIIYGFVASHQARFAQESVVTTTFKLTGINR